MNVGEALFFYMVYLLTYMAVPFGFFIRRFLGVSFYFKMLRLSYDLFSRFYDSFTLSLPNYLNVCKLVAYLANPSETDRVLDVACGTGLVSLSIAERAGEVVGIDLSLGQLKRLKAKASSKAVIIHIVLGDARTLPFRSEVFNTVTSSDALSEIVEKEAVVKEMCRVVKKRGRVVIMTVDGENIPILQTWAYDGRRLKRNLRGCGMREIRVAKIPPFYLIAKAEKC